MTMIKILHVWGSFKCCIACLKAKTIYLSPWIFFSFKRDSLFHMFSLTSFRAWACQWARAVAVVPVCWKDKQSSVASTGQCRRKKNAQTWEKSLFCFEILKQLNLHYAFRKVFLHFLCRTPANLPLRFWIHPTPSRDVMNTYEYQSFRVFSAEKWNTNNNPAWGRWTQWDFWDWPWTFIVNIQTSKPSKTDSWRSGKITPKQSNVFEKWPPSSTCS